MNIDLVEIITDFLKNDKIKKAFASIFRSSMDEMQNELGELKEENQAQSDTIQQLKDENGKHASKERDLESQLAQAEQKARTALGQNNEWKENAESTQRKCAELDAKLRTAEKERDVCKTELANLKKELSRYENIHKTFLDLPEKTQKSLEGIFPNKEMVPFLVCGVQPQKLDLLWDFCANEFMGGNTGHSKELETICCFFFELTYSSIDAKPSRKLQEVKVGDDFDLRNHDKTSSAPRGKIKAVLLPGIVSGDGKKVIRKAVVSL